MKTLKERTLEKLNKEKEQSPNVACFVVYVEATDPNLILSGPEPISKAKLAKLIHTSKLLSSCEVDGVVAYRVLV